MEKLRSIVQDTDTPAGKAFDLFTIGIILLSLLPFFIFSGVDLRSIRVFRLFRLLRVFKLTRYMAAVQRLKVAFAEIKEELTLHFAVTAFVIYFASIGIYYFENEAQPDIFRSVFHAMWWAVATLTTVGYGDIYPVTDGGKLFTFVILIFGLGVVTVPSALLAAALTRREQRENRID